MKTVVVCVALYVALCCAAPSTPVWPSAFSTGIDDVRQHPPRVLTGRWFWSEAMKSDRYDVQDSPGDFFNLEINRYDLGKRFLVVGKKDHDPTCTVTNIPKDMPKFDFSKFTFQGNQSIRGHNVEVWQYTTPSTAIEYFVDGATQEPVQFRRRNHTQHDNFEETHFFEFDKGTQDPNLFNIPPLCANQTEFKPQPLKVGLDPAICTKAAGIARGKATCGCPYVWGGNECECSGKGGLDCSGLTSYAYRTAGYGGIARTAAAQSHQGGSCGACHPSNTAACREGDLFFFDFGGSGIDHVNMFIGGRDVAECPKPGEDCHVIPAYTEAYVTCRRFC